MTSNSISPTVPSSVAPAALAGVLCEAILYGILILLTMASLYVLLFKRKNHLNIPMVVVSVLLFILATAHISVDIVALFQAYGDLDLSSRLARIANSTKRINLAKVAIFDVAMVLGDGIVTYRCYIVYGKNKWIVTPSIMLSAFSAVLSALTVYAGCKPKTKLGITILKQIQDYGVVSFVLSLAANIIATGLIAVRIWRSSRMFPSQMSMTGRSSSRSTRSSLIPVAAIVIESGALNAAFLITYTFVLVATRYPGNLAIVADMILIDISTSIVGIVFSMVIVRVGMRLPNEEQSTMSSFKLRSPKMAVRLPWGTSHESQAESSIDQGSTSLGELEAARYKNESPNELTTHI